MCGIAGIAFSKKNLTFIRQMSDALYHRGPDSSGIWSDREYVALGHQRLSLLDLSRAGHQPMISLSGRYILTCNGEIYNFLELKASLIQEGVSFRGYSDTEVLLALLEKYGIERTLPMLNGMFAFALWDTQEKTLFLARDRFGEKPLYYAWINDGFVFASELKALKVYPEWPHPSLDSHALALYLQYLYVPAPHTIYKDVKKLEPATFLTITKGGQQKETKYWSAIDVALTCRQDQPVLSEQEWVSRLDDALTRAIKIRKIADVPLGAFLSGGMDSSIITALMQKNSSSRIKTFTIGFSSHAYNEAPFAKEVAARLNTDHHEIYMENKHVLNIIPTLPVIYDEPFADSSQIPTVLVSQIARQYVTGCLAGDGGDELFGGYNRYLFYTRFQKQVENTPLFLRMLLSKGLRQLSPEQWDAIYYRLLRRKNVHLFGNKIYKIARLLASKNIVTSGYQSALTSVDSHRYLLNASSHNPFIDTHEDLLEILDPVSWMMLNDVVGYLPGDLLTKTDRASMSVSLEARLPFLDPDLFCFSWHMPINMKIYQCKTKWPLRQLLTKYLPSSLVDRPKTGFGVPLDEWLRGPLLPWAEHLLSHDSLKKSSQFKIENIRRLWEMHKKGRNESAQLWPFLMFQAWYELNG